MNQPRIQIALFCYAGLNEFTAESLLTEKDYAHQIGAEFHYQRISNDALIPRSRSRGLSNFLNQTDLDVMVMIDHDIQWNRGDIFNIAHEALRTNALVGGLYSKRTHGGGWSSRITAEGAFGFGVEGVLACDYLATGFLAIPRAVALDIQQKLDIDGPLWQERLNQLQAENNQPLIRQHYDLSLGRIQEETAQYYDFFRCFRQPNANGSYDFLSEDWAFSARAKYCGHPLYISTKPILVHYGDYGFTPTDGMAR